MADTAIRVLGIDTALRCTGYAVIEGHGQRLRAVGAGVIRNTPRDSHSTCLLHLASGVEELITRFTPQEVAIEGVFFCKNVGTAVILGEARGAVIATCAARGIPVYEYSPRRVKQAVVGNGAADKSQVSRMVMSMLGLGQQPQADAGDAMAVAICHCHQRTGLSALAPVPL